MPSIVTICFCAARLVCIFWYYWLFRIDGLAQWYTIPNDVEYRFHGSLHSRRDKPALHNLSDALQSSFYDLVE